jgi:hypothetical protein
MNLPVSEALTIAGKWQNATTRVNGTMQSRKWAIDFEGRLVVERNVIVVTLTIGDAGWLCNLYEPRQ